MKPSETIAWRLICGHTMTGDIDRLHFHGTRALVRRIDGTLCTVELADARPATLEDVENAARFYANLGNRSSDQ